MNVVLDEGTKQLNEEQQACFDLVMSGVNCFITGGAGSGCILMRVRAYNFSVKFITFRFIILFVGGQSKSGRGTLDSLRL